MSAADDNVPVRVLFFSVLQDAVRGEKEVPWQLEHGRRTVEDLLAGLYARWPELQLWDRQVRVAVDLEYVDRDHVLCGGEEVALIPPVQGG